MHSYQGVQAFSALPVDDQKLMQMRAFIVRLCMQVTLVTPNNHVARQALAYLKTIGMDAEGISAEQEAQLVQLLAEEAPRRETDQPGESFRTLRATPDAADATRDALARAAATGNLAGARVPSWPSAADRKFTTDRGANDPHNMQNRHAPLNRRRTDQE